MVRCRCDLPNLIMQWVSCGDFSGVASYAKHNRILQNTEKSHSLVFLNHSNPKNQAIGCLEIVTFVVSGLLSCR